MKYFLPNVVGLDKDVINTSFAEVITSIHIDLISVLTEGKPTYRSFKIFRIIPYGQ